MVVTVNISIMRVGIERPSRVRRGKMPNVPETGWKINYNGWIISVRAMTYGKAKYQAWLKFKDEFGTSLRDFVYDAREG